MPKEGARFFAAAVSLAFATSLQPANAQDFSFRVGHVFAADHWVWVHGGQYFIDALRETAGDQVSWEVFPAGQLGRDYVTALQTGVVDAAILVPGYTPESFLLSSVAELPIKIESSCAGTDKLWEITKAGAVLDTDEYAPAGMRMLFAFYNPPYKLFTTSKEVKTLEDLAGLKLRAAGPAMQETARALDAVPVQIAGPEVYDALSRGTIDGAIFPFSSVEVWSIENVVKYGVDGFYPGALTTLFGMSREKYDAMPDDLKAKVDEAAMKTQAHICAWLDEEEARLRDIVVNEHGWKIYTLPEDEAARWEARMQPVLDQWAEKMDALGKPGTEALEAFIAADGSK